MKLKRFKTIKLTIGKFYYSIVFWTNFNKTMRKQSKKEKMIKGYLEQKFKDAGMDQSLQTKLLKIFLDNNKAILNREVVKGVGELKNIRIRKTEE